MLIKSENKILNNSSGFTLFELMVSISIIALVSSIFLVNYHGTNKRSELNVEKQKLASNIRLAQNYCLGSKTYDGITTPSGGWGVHFDSIDYPASYIIFADKAGGGFPNGNQRYDAGEAIETKTLPVGVTVDSLRAASSLVSKLDVVFFPPDPTTYVNNSIINSARIVLRENANNSTVAVTVNFFGLIDTE